MLVHDHLRGLLVYLLWHFVRSNRVHVRSLSVAARLGRMQAYAVDPAFWHFVFARSFGRSDVLVSGLRALRLRLCLRWILICSLILRSVACMQAYNLELSAMLKQSIMESSRRAGASSTSGRMALRAAMTFPARRKITASVPVIDGEVLAICISSRGRSGRCASGHAW